MFTAPWRGGQNARLAPEPIPARSRPLPFRVAGFAGFVEAFEQRVHERRPHHDTVGALGNGSAPAQPCFTPKPTATGSRVWRLIRATAPVTLLVSGAAVPVTPVTET